MSGPTVYAYVDGNPLGYVDPSGLVIANLTVNGDDVSITLRIKYTGQTTPAQAAAWNKAIHDAWSRKFGKYNVNLNIVNGVDGMALLNTIEVSEQGWVDSRGRSRSKVNGVGGATGTWRLKDGCIDAVHEVGHLMDLGDKYYDNGVPYPGWEENIMGNPKGKIDERNIKSIIDRYHWRTTPGASYVPE